MGAKIRKVLAALVAAAMIMTSGIGVFAADSSTVGKIASGSATASSTTSAAISWAKADGAKEYKIYVNGTYKATVPGTSATVAVPKNTAVTITVAPVSKNGKEGAKVVVGRVWTKKVTKVKAKKRGSRKLRITWKKLKGVTGYRVQVYNKAGKLVYNKKVSKKATSKVTKKLKKGGGYRVKVIPLKGSYTGVAGTKGSVKVK